jgi:DNA processing protein
MTVAVIASGIGRITPRHALRLADAISANNGAVVSEYPFHVAALPPYFPARNRIISGMSDAVVVIESNATGGALITADFALEQNRPLYAVPGNITSSRSRGTNELLASGVAHVLVDADTLLRDLGLEARTEPHRPLPPEIAFLGGDPLGVDAVAREWECSAAEALSRLFHYELEGLVRQLPGSRFVAAM